MIQQSINLAGVVPESITDGPGIRYAIFCQGCPHHCEGCHNQETWHFEEKERRTPQELFEEIQKNPLVKGVTFSGGEPFAQAEAFAELAELLKEKNYEVAVYTGYIFEDILDSSNAEWHRLLEATDILIDGLFEEKLRDLSLWFRGSSNQRILSVKESLAQKKAVLCTEERWTGKEQ
jgi:anaerobic ribonucleoside-triphosphate reductase activating protein